MMPRFFAYAAVALLALAGPMRAGTIPAPTGEVILSITGVEAEPVQFDRESLSSLGLETVKTSTIWTEGTQTFEGVSLKAITDALGIEDGMLFATAINDYTVEIPVSDAVGNGPIIALALNGEAMSIRDKGPLWVIYPYDSSAAYRTEVVYSRSIWQLDRIEVVD